MSVKAYLGVPGSGKSLHVMDDIYWYSKNRDALILTNFELLPPRGSKASFALLPSGELAAKDVLDAVRTWTENGHRVKREGQILVIIDEAQIPFNNREWQKSGRQEWIRLFIQHRKMGMNFVLVVQSLAMLDKQIQAVVETTAHHMRVNTYGWFGRLVTLLALGKPICMCVYRLPFYGSSKAGIIGREVVVGRKRLYRMYDTHALFSDGLDAVVWDE